MTNATLVFLIMNMLIIIDNDCNYDYFFVVYRPSHCSICSHIGCWMSWNP